MERSGTDAYEDAERDGIGADAAAEPIEIKASIIAWRSASHRGANHLESVDGVALDLPAVDAEVRRCKHWHATES